MPVRVSEGKVKGDSDLSIRKIVMGLGCCLSVERVLSVHQALVQSLT